jgi:hypothetical protein
MLRQHHTTAVVATALALTASLAPMASADPAPLARAEAAIAATPSSGPVRPNPDEQTVTGATVNTGPCSEVCSGGLNPYGSRLHPASLALPDTHTTASTAPHAVRVVAPDSFDWGDAGIGAGASLALFGIALVGARAATNGRRRHTREQRAIVTN